MGRNYVAISTEKIDEIAGTLEKCAKVLRETAESMKKNDPPLAMLRSSYFKMQDQSLPWIVKFSADMAGSLEAAKAEASIGVNVYRVNTLTDQAKEPSQEFPVTVTEKDAPKKKK